MGATQHDWRLTKQCLVHAVLDKIDGKFVPPPSPQSRLEICAFWLLHCFILDLGGGVGWGFAVPFYSVQVQSAEEGGWSQDVVHV